MQIYNFFPKRQFFFCDTHVITHHSNHTTVLS